MDLFLQPVRRIHISGNLRYEMETNTDVRNLYFLSTIALLILLIACFNFMNLTTAQVAKRSKEVGLRKVVGSSRWQLIRQFLGESTVFALLAMGFSILIIKLCFKRHGNTHYILCYNSFYRVSFRILPRSFSVLFPANTHLEGRQIRIQKVVGIPEYPGCIPVFYYYFPDFLRILNI